MTLDLPDYDEHGVRTEKCPTCRSAGADVQWRVRAGGEYTRCMQSDERPPAGLRTFLGYVTQACERRAACACGHDVLGEGRDAA